MIKVKLNKERYFKFFYLILLISITLLGCSANNSEDFTLKSDYKMGTIVQLKAYGKNLEGTVKEAFTLIDHLEQKMSLNIEGSEINQVNNLAGQKGFQASDDTYLVIDKALNYAKLSQGSFDPSIGPVVKLWGIGSEKQRVPSKEELAAKLKLVDYRQIQLNPDNKSISLTTEGMILDVGGIAKGYAADKVIEFLKSQGVKSAYVSLGGNVSVLGTKPDGSNWKVGIQDPKAKSRGEVVGVVSLKDKTVVTSGNYERYFIEDGVRYHHILNPKTGYPAKNGVISATIIAESSFDADALSTAVYILGIKHGLELVNQLDGIEAILITEENQIYVTANLKDKFKLTKKNKYTLAN
ncbi:thiamine biosynthesis lipoprotein [Orenia metallireducens]|uniref:FAD:protein FMN transferase n=2 Tax=Orenia metallireducens TaxID=1413210 RepID=A0A285HFA5_9FIRM|nr:thiamine biosynthesis lipoprotein [Orenia metallireducens]SNY34429.1 thiamine biosynthesis lipoprotein [Orenia metallireducens]